MNNKFFYIVAASAFFAACSADDLTDWNEQPGGPGINFGASAPTSDNISRGGAAYSSQSIILKSDNSADSLAVYVESNPGFINERTVSRGAPVTADNFNAFSVSAFYYRDETVAAPTEFFKEKVTRQAGGAWSTETIYYWPTTEGSQLAFLGVSPSDISVNPAYGATLTATSESGYSLTYTAPSGAENQPDLMLAVAGKQNGHNQPDYKVPMQFRHILSQVRFEVGTEMQNGTINSITLDGIASSGTYDGAAGAWTLAAGATASYTIDVDAAMSTSTASGTGINRVEQTLMMLPQTLTADSKLTITFTKDGATEPTVLTANLSGAWTLGGSTVYRINIKPDYTLEFASEPKVQDAHYVIYPIRINADKVPDGRWTLTSNNPDNVTFVEKFSADGIKKLVDEGYWLKDNCGASTLTSTTSGSDINVYVFLKENISDADRDIVLSLSPANDPKSVSATFNFKQYCPSWNNGIGVERIQEKDYPWGFLWDSNMKITYSMPGGFAGAIYHVLFEIFGDKTYVESTGSALAGNWKVSLDFSKLPPLTTAKSTTDGLTNTWELYNFEGLNEASVVMNQIVSWGGTTTDVMPTNPTEYAAWACAKKNMYSTEHKTNSGNNIYAPVLSQTDMVWYLPAKDEGSEIVCDVDEAMSGDYWTSTASGDTNAWVFTYKGAQSEMQRDNAAVHVRAVRKKS